MQPDARHEAVHYKRGTGHVATAFQDVDEEEEEQDLRQKNDDAAEAGQHAIGEKIVEDAGRQVCRKPGGGCDENEVDQVHEGCGPGEDRLKDHHQDQPENGRSKHPVGDHGIDPVGEGMMVAGRGCGRAARTFADKIVPVQHFDGHGIAAGLPDHGTGFIHHGLRRHLQVGRARGLVKRGTDLFVADQPQRLNDVRGGREAGVRLNPISGNMLNSQQE